METNCNLVIIKEGTTKIKDNEFLNNKKIKEIVIPDSVIFIGNSAFKGCSNLKNKFTQLFKAYR